MKVHDIVRFSKESYFNGAVQTEWFYDKEKVRRIAENYVFHGPKYYGVSAADVSLGQHKLIDTASFAKTLTDKMYSDRPDNCFVMTIAGYGTGKSHLAVSLGALFSGDAAVAASVHDNIAKADVDISNYIRAKNTLQNFVIVLNGMNNFNLDSEILRCVRLTLEQNGLGDSILRHLTKSYEIAKHFVERTFSMCQAQFETVAQAHQILKCGEALKSHLLTTVESDSSTLSIINAIYEELNGDSIHWNRGISAGDILTALQQELCGPGHMFNKILVLFDEFGRYIEYAAANPTIAGEASLQQIFEAVQGADGKILFVGFIQSELDAYLSRIEKTSNIVRYIGRYKGSENLFLSSNFETILSNLISKTDAKFHERILDNALNRYDKFHRSIESALNRWDKSAIKKSVWTTSSLYKMVVLKGCYPLHPITVWLLSSMSNWMQQRSAITFASEMVDGIAFSEIREPWLPYVYPIDIIKSSIYDEMLNSEEKGLVQSQYCMLYRDIMIKVGNKLSDDELHALQAILITNIGRFSFADQEDAITAIHYCSNLKEETARAALKSLENMHGVIVFDENAHTFDLVAEANGFNEFKRIFTRYRLGVAASIEDCDANIQKDLSLDREMETSFAQDHNIASTEWSFNRALVDSTSITEFYLSSAINRLNASLSGESSRGLMIYAYCAKNAESEVERISFLYKKLSLKNYPVIILFLDDNEQEVLSSLAVINTLRKFSKADVERFRKHIANQLCIHNKKVCGKITALLSNRVLIDECGLQTYSGRQNNLGSECFNTIYHAVPPFMFDGFEKKTTAQAKRYLTNICIKLFDRTLMNVQSYHALTQDEKNRIRSTLSTKVATSWRVFDDSCRLVEPQNENLRIIYDEIFDTLHDDTPVSFNTLFGKYQTSPYGMNDNAIALFGFYFIAKQENAILCFYGQEKLSASHLSDKIFKQGNLQRQELLKIRIQKNPNIEVDVVARICNEILANVYVENHSVLNSKLSDALLQEGISTGNQLLVSQAKMRLDETLKQKNQIYSKLQKAQAYITDAYEKLVIHKFVKVFECISDTTLPIAENLPLVFSDEFFQAQKKVRADIEKILKEKYSDTLSKFTCNITQLSQVKTLYKNVVKVLNEQGYSGLAAETDERILSLEEELLAKQKYDSSIVECQKELALHANLENYTHKKCTELLVTLNGWQTFFSEVSDLPNAVFKLLLENITTAISQVKKRLSDIQMEFATCIDDFKSAANAESLQQVESLMKRIQTLQFDDQTHLRLTSNLNDIAVAMAIIDAAPDSIDELDEFVANMTQTVPESCRSAVCGELANIRQKYSSDQEVWIKRYLAPIDTGLRGMSGFDCANWMEKTKILPTYLDGATASAYRVALNKVEMQLHNSRVQGVVSMFNKLSESEKAECIRIICSK